MGEGIGAALLAPGAERLTGTAGRACAFTRSNGPVFYAVGAPLLLTARWHAMRERAAYGFRDDPALRVWLLQECAPRRLARVQRLREYAIITWPDLDWNAVDERFNRLLDCNAAPLESSLAQRALAQCTVASQGAVFFRCLAHWAEDGRLRAIAETSAAEESEAFTRFRALYDQLVSHRPLGFRAAWQTVRRAMRAARDVHVQAAFEALFAQWGPNAPFPVISYAELLQRVGAAMDAHAALSWTERLIFRPWKETPRPLAVSVRERAQTNFKPVLPEPRDPWCGVREKARWQP